MKELKDRLETTVFEYLDSVLPDHVKKKLTSSDVREIVLTVMLFVDDHKDAISVLREPIVLHKPAASFADRQNSDSDQEPDFLADLSKV